MIDYADVLLPKPAPGGPEFWRGTIVGTNPLRVERVQGVMPATPENYAGQLFVGDRVFGATINTRPVIIGRTGGGGQPYAMAAGHVSVSASGGIGTAEVSFPPGRFTVSPMITVSAHSTSENITNVQFTDTSKDGFTAVLLRSNDVATGVHWQAVQMTPDSAEG
ncbi:MAG TPA: hypothetical protein VK054_13360 [Beutenbergiaceae bacterium]|nr:hypothetical protein [Beutenbergiaceae bacterium]